MFRFQRDVFIKLEMVFGMAVPLVVVRGNHHDM